MGAGHAPKGAFFFSVWKKMVGIRILQVLNQKQIFFKTLYFLWTRDTLFGEGGNKSRLAEMFFPASASCKLTSSGPQLFSMWLCYFHSFMGYGDPSKHLDSAWQEASARLCCSFFCLVSCHISSKLLVCVASVFRQQDTLY